MLHFRPSPHSFRICLSFPISPAFYQSILITVVYCFHMAKLQGSETSLRQQTNEPSFTFSTTNNFRTSSGSNLIDWGVRAGTTYAFFNHTIANPRISLKRKWSYTLTLINLCPCLVYFSVLDERSMLACLNLSLVPLLPWM